MIRAALLVMAVVVADASLYPFFTSALPAPVYEDAQIRVRRDVAVPARDGNRLATDLYLPPGEGKRPAIVMRTPYGKQRAEALMRALARHDYVGVAQDCRGTGASEPGQWDMYMYEKEDSYDTVEWVRVQPWSDGKIGGTGGSYVGETQWFMSFHPAMTAIAPEVAGIGDGVSNGVRLHGFVSAYARTVGKSGGRDKAPVVVDVMERQMAAETLAGGLFNAPLEQGYPVRVLARFPELRPLSESERARAMRERYAALPARERTELVRFLLDAPEVNYANLGDLPPVFGPEGAGPAFKYVAPSLADVYRRLNAPALMITGWYDWGLDLTFETWRLIERFAPTHVRDHTYLIVGPNAHAGIGYREGAERRPTLGRTYQGLHNLEPLVRWYEHWLKGGPNTLDGLSRITYYLMGADAWKGTSAWPPPEARLTKLFLDSNGGANGLAGSGTLTFDGPGRGGPDSYVYDPADPPPTTGGSIVSTIIPTGSTDQRPVQTRRDVLVYSTEPLAADLEVTGPLSVVLYASSSAVDTDFTAKLTDVFPDGRAILIQGGIVRARFREPNEPPSLIDPGTVYRYEIDLWATANLFRRGHRVRLEIASADFPRFERNANRGGSLGPPARATQTVFHDSKYPSHVVIPVVGRP